MSQRERLARIRAELDELLAVIVEAELKGDELRDRIMDGLHDARELCRS